MKTLIVNSRDNTRIPFLRGILTRTLLDAGMPFEDAFELATDVRNELAETAELSSDELRKLVLKKMAEVADRDVLDHYRAPTVLPARVVIHKSGGTRSRFSRGKHVRLLQASGISTTVAEEITSKLYQQLLGSGATAISEDGLGYLTYCCIRQEVSKKAAERFLVWTQFDNGEKPLILLLGGAVGAGKSSIATQIAHRLEIVRTPSTDMLREVMRMMVPERLLPMLHTSSFDAWRCLPVHDSGERDHDALVAEGFRLQAEMLAVSCEAVLNRADQEGVSMILEGVHALPGLLRTIRDGSEAIGVHVTLAVLRAGELKGRLRGRSTTEPKRRAKRYLKSFDSIWSLQSYLLSEADRHSTAIIPNDDFEKAIQKVTITVNNELRKHFKGSPTDVFGQVAELHERRPHKQNWEQLVPELIKQ